MLFFYETIWFRRYYLISYWCLKNKHFKFLSNINHCFFEYRFRWKYSISHNENDSIVINSSNIRLFVDTNELYKRTQSFINSNNVCYLYSKRFDCVNIVVFMTKFEKLIFNFAWFWSLTFRTSSSSKIFVFAWYIRIKW